jgi:transcriptional regulator with XRE-family HTH domain
MKRRKLYDDAESILIGGRIIRIRTEKNITRLHLSGIIGISYQQLHKYEKGHNTLSVIAMKKIAFALEVSACEICGCCDE